MVVSDGDNAGRAWVAGTCGPLPGTSLALGLPGVGNSFPGRETRNTKTSKSVDQATRTTHQSKVLIRVVLLGYRPLGHYLALNASQYFAVGRGLQTRSHQHL